MQFSETFALSFPLLFKVAELSTVFPLNKPENHLTVIYRYF